MAWGFGYVDVTGISVVGHKYENLFVLLVLLAGKPGVALNWTGMDDRRNGLDGM